jgi:hypothetical protein
METQTRHRETLLPWEKVAELELDQSGPDIDESQENLRRKENNRGR